jgi:hypothetical protein
LTDQQQIRQFELLFSAVDELQVIIGTDFEYQADTAAATANEALAQLSALAQDTAVEDAVLNAKVQQALDAIPGLAQALELLALAPRQELGTIASQNSDNVNITGGLISGLDAPLPVASGGIGVTTALANKVFAGPTAGAAAPPAFRALVSADIPALPYGTGDVVGPASATDNAVARFDTTTGKLIQNSVVTISDTGATTGVTTLGASTSVTTPIVQASNSAGLSLKNASGTTQMSVGAGGGDNMSVNVSTNLNGTNAQIDISPTGTGHVHIKPTGIGSVEVAPTNVGTIDNMTIGATTPKNASFVDLSVTGTTSFDGAQGTSGQVLTSAGTGNTPTWTTPTTGTVTAVSVVSANGLAGTVATSTTTPAITLSTTITGLLKGNGTAISAATSGTDYAPATSGTSILYGNGSGGFSNVTIGSGVSFAAGTLSATGSGGTVTSVAALTLGTTGTDLSSTVANGTTTPVITLNVPTASATNRGALSSTDWSTFNNKQSVSAPVTKTADFTVAATELWLINNKSGSTCTATLPAASSYSGRVLHFQNYQAQTLVSASSNVVPLAGGAAGTSILLASAGDSATLVSDGSNWLMTQYIPNNILLLE